MGRAATITLVLLLVATALTPTTVAADDGSFFDDVLGTDEDDTEDSSVLDAVSTLVSTVRSYVGGLSDRASLAIRGDSDDVDEAADDMKEFYNDHSTEFEDYANSRTDADTDLDVVKIELATKDGSEDLFIVADVNGSDYENSSIVESTSRNVDETIWLCGQAALRADDELELFYEEFVEPDEDVTAEYLAQTRGRYGKSVRSTVLNHTECEP